MGDMSKLGIFESFKVCPFSSVSFLMPHHQNCDCFGHKVGLQCTCWASFSPSRCSAFIFSIFSWCRTSKTGELAGNAKSVYSAHLGHFWVIQGAGICTSPRFCGMRSGESTGPRFTSWACFESFQNLRNSWRSTFYLQHHIAFFFNRLSLILLWCCAGEGPSAAVSDGGSGNDPESG